MGSGGSAEVGGARVFRVQPGSPAAEAGLEPFFDLILEAGGTPIEAEYKRGRNFGEMMLEAENTTVKLKVYSARSRAVRDAEVRPRKWAGAGILGARLQYDTVVPEEGNGIRVLEVFPNSPAAHAGLIPFQDFLLGPDCAIFKDLEELMEEVNGSMGQRMTIYTYNSDAETVREIVLVPNTGWGGSGCVGCDIGTGQFHRIPAPQRPPGSAAAAAAVAAAAPTFSMPSALSPAPSPAASEAQPDAAVGAAADAAAIAAAQAAAQAAAEATPQAAPQEAPQEAPPEAPPHAPPQEAPQAPPEAKAEAPQASPEAAPQEPTQEHQVPPAEAAAVI